MDAFDRTRDDILATLTDAVGIAWDGCHKIYILMDETEYKLWEEYGYDPLIRVDSPDQALVTLQDWWEQSCGLRFINSVRTTLNPNDGFDDLIPQFADED